MAKNLYQILGVPQNATPDQILDAYAKKKNKLQLERNSGAIETQEFIQRLSELDEAKNVLLDEARRRAYNNGVPALTTGAKKGVPAVRNNKQNGLQNNHQNNQQPSGPDDDDKKGKSILPKVAIAACVAALAVSILGYMWLDRNKDKDKGNDLPTPPGIVTVTPNPDESTGIETPTPGETETPAVPSTVPEMINRGDAKDDAVVTERANKLLEELNANGLYNIGTNAPYTVDELKTLIQYMNGAYKPQNEDEAYTLVNEILNFACAPLNSEQVLYAVQYQGGEDSFKDIVQSNSENFHPINIVDNMLLGNTSAYPYLKWFENQYNAMICTTDRDECARIYDSMVQSLADMVYGDGFTLDDKVYDKNDVLGLDRVNAGNTLQILTYIMEPFRTTKTKDTFTVHNKLVSANPEENAVTVSYQDIMEFFNIDCEDKLAEIAVDDEGLLLIDNPNGKNFHYINQVNTINRALMEFFGKNQAYTNVYQKSLHN